MKKVKDLLKRKIENNTEAMCYKQIALSLFQLREAELALSFFEYYKKNCPDDKSILIYLGYLYDQKKDKQKALEYLEASKEIYPNDYHLFGTIGRIYSELSTFAYKHEQLNNFRRAYELEPNDTVNLMNMLLMSCKFNNFQEAEGYWELLKLKVGIDKIDPALLFSYGCFLIHNKDFERGFKLYRHRFDYDANALPAGLKNIWQPNIDVSEKTMLVTYEQGFGDTLLFIRFIKDIIPRCKKAMVLVQNELYDLLKDNFDFEIYPSRDLEKLEYDYFLPIMDIPILIGLTPDNITGKEGYLTVSQEKIDKYNYVPKNDKFKIGLCYEGSKDGVVTCRDVPLEKFYPLMELPNVEIYCFQKQDIKKQMKKVPKEYPFKILGNTFKSWEDTACAMKHMDLMICTDTGVLNLAGALGIKTFALFNEYPEFRWFDLSKDVGWFNMKPFQCKEFDKWEEPISEIIEEVKKLIKEKENGKS